MVPINKLYFVDKEKYLKERFSSKVKSYKCVDDNLIINFNSCFIKGKIEYRITGTAGESFLVLNNKDRQFNKETYNNIYSIIKLNNRIVDKKISEELKWEFCDILDGEKAAIIYKNKLDNNRIFLLKSSIN